MFAKRRQRRSIKKVTVYFLSTILLCIFFFVIYVIISMNKPLFISPIGENTNLKIASLQKVLKNSNILFSSIAIATDLSYVIILTGGEQIDLSKDKNINEQVSSLQRILRELTIEEKAFKSIDFRFEKPVIVFKEKL